MSTLTKLQASQVKVAGDQTRLLIIKHLALAGEEGLNVSTLVEKLQRDQPKVSHHLAILLQHNIVHRAKQGRWRYYTLNPQTCFPDWVRNEVVIVVERGTIRLDIR